MAEVVFARSASEDEATILVDLSAKAGGRVAIRYRTLFTRLYDLLAEHPALGAPRPLLGRGVRIGIVAPYIVIYDLTEREDTVTILRIVHGRRNISARLLAQRD